MNDLDPGVLLELLPTKIRAMERVLAELSLDIASMEVVNLALAAGEQGIPPKQLEDLRQSRRLHVALRDEYQRRLTALQDAAKG